MSLRIAFVGQKGFPATWGGVEAHVDAISRRLAARGHEVTVYSRGWYAPGADADAEADGVHRVTLPTVRSKHLDASVHSLIAAAHAATRTFDVVHFHAMGPALFSFLPRLRGHRVVTTLHGHDYMRDKWGAVAQRVLKLGESVAFRCSDHVVVVSKSLAEGYQRAGRKVHYIPNGIEPMPVAPSPSGNYLLSLGRWVPEKRVAELVAAFAKVDPPGVELVVAGQADERSYDQRVRDAAGGHPRVRFPGYVTGPDKDELIANAKGFVTASALEGLPVTLLEALAAGTPCAASNIEPHDEVLGNLCPEALFKLGEAERGIRWLLALDDDEEHRRARAKAVTREYSWDRCTDALEELYR